MIPVDAFPAPVRRLSGRRSVSDGRDPGRRDRGSAVRRDIRPVPVRGVGVRTTAVDR